MAARYGAETPVLDWRERLLPSRRDSRQVDMVVSGTRGPPMLETIEMGLPKAQPGEQVAAPAGEPS
jgi:hypothetical protein